MKPIYMLLSGLLTVFLGGVIPVAGAEREAASLQLCLAAAADDSPVYPTRTFPPGTKEVLALFQLGQGETPRKLAGTWVALDIGNAAPKDSVIAKSELRVRGRRGSFRLTGRGPAGLPAGKYRFDLMADGKPWQSVDFTIVAVGRPHDVQRPADLLPLTSGKVWTYAFLQEAGPGAKVSLPGITPDADGKLRATVTLTVAKTGERGTLIELRRNGAHVFDQWWRVDGSGLRLTGIQVVGEELAPVDPPEVLWPFPLRTPQTWRWESNTEAVLKELGAKDSRLRRVFHMWGPLPVNGPRGEAPGYVVLSEERVKPQEGMQALAITVERHFLPGAGMVREVIIQALNTEMVSRQELMLKDKP